MCRIRPEKQEIRPLYAVYYSGRGRGRRALLPRKSHLGITGDATPDELQYQSQESAFPWVGSGTGGEHEFDATRLECTERAAASSLRTPGFRRRRASEDRLIGLSAFGDRGSGLGRIAVRAAAPFPQCSLGSWKERIVLRRAMDIRLHRADRALAIAQLVEGDGEAVVRVDLIAAQIDRRFEEAPRLCPLFQAEQGESHVHMRFRQLGRDRQDLVECGQRILVLAHVQHHHTLLEAGAKLLIVGTLPRRADIEQLAEAHVGQIQRGQRSGTPGDHDAERDRRCGGDRQRSAANVAAEVAVVGDGVGNGGAEHKRTIRGTTTVTK